MSQRGPKFNGTHQLLVYADDVTILDKNINPIKRNREALLEADLELNTEKTVVVSRHQNTEQNQNLPIALNIWQSSNIWESK